ncbi:MAG TPA: glycosyl hydrolase family 18 protein [Ktedonobacterales bacterium]
MQPERVLFLAQVNALQTIRKPKLEKSADTFPNTTRWYWRLLRAAGIALALLTVLVGFLWWRLNATETNFSGAHFNQEQNAVWAEHAWVGESHTPQEYDDLAALLRQEQIGYLFPHVGPLNGDGTIPLDLYPNAAAFVREMKSRLPNLKILAWIGQIEKDGGGPLDMSNAQTRANIAAEARRFTQALGFDGIHYDIEPVHNLNPHFIDLLDETRAAIGSSKVLSISAPKWAPAARVIPFVQAISGRGTAWWTTYYFLIVSSHIDQLVVMMYNTALPTADLYETLVKQETAHILDANSHAQHPAQVLIGIPTYHDNGPGFHDSAENMFSGLRGVTAGLNSGEDTSHFGGIAIYPLWLTTESDWQTYNHLWLGE